MDCSRQKSTSIQKFFAFVFPALPATRRRCEEDAELFGSAPVRFSLISIFFQMRARCIIRCIVVRKRDWQARVDHGWSAAFIRGQQANTPAWRSTRKVIFMMTTTRNRLLAARRYSVALQIAADHQQALTVGNQILSLVSDPPKELFTQIQHDADYFRRVCLSYALHIRETNIAQQ